MVRTLDHGSRMNNRRLLVCALGGILGGCSTSADVPDVPLYVLEQDLRIGALDGPTALGEVIDVAVGSAGELYVVEWNEGSLAVFDAEGRPRQRIGRAGSGPGEFTMFPGGVHWTGTLLSASDPQADRLHLFRRDGSLDRTIAERWQPISDSIRAPRPTVLLADGSVLGFAAAARNPRDPDAELSALLVRLREGTPTLDTIARVISPQTSLTIPRGHGVSETVNPVSDQPLWAAAADGGSIVIVDRSAATAAGAATFAVTRIDLAGDTTLNRSYPYTPVPIDGFHTDSITDLIAHRLDHGDELDMLRATLRDLDFLPAFFPPITRLVTGRDGTIWLRREGAEDPVLWEVIDSEGAIVRRVAMPAGLTVHEADERYVWGVSKDELEVSYVVRYRFAAAGG